MSQVSFESTSILCGSYVTTVDFKFFSKFYHAV